ncbi:hypothetical protein YC2023_087440 [Brassica napus]
MKRSVFSFLYRPGHLCSAFLIDSDDLPVPFRRQSKAPGKMSPAEAAVSQWLPQVRPHSYLESGKLITCGSTNDLGQSYVTSGKHCETPEPFPLPPEVFVQKAEAGWDHCVARTMKFMHGDGRNVYPQEECLDKWKEIRVK